jgi:hypothetical protein
LNCNRTKISLASTENYYKSSKCQSSRTRKESWKLLSLRTKRSTHLMCSKKELIIYIKENSMENLKVTCAETSLKADSKALFIQAKLSKKIKKESP